jgi:N-acetylneuraminic acid mutarotase
MRLRLALAALGLGLALSGCSGSPATTSPAPARSSTGAASPSAVPATGAGRPAVTTLAWHLPVAVSRQALVDLGDGQVLLAGGMLAGDSSTAATYRLDLATGRSTRAPALTVPVHDAAGGRYAGAPAVFGGGNATEQSLVQALRGGSWRKVDAFPTTRSDLSAVAAAGTTILLGGYDGSAVPRTIFTQRGSSQMRPTGTLVRGVRYAATAVVGGQVYVFGGEVSGAELSTVQRVDPRTGRTRVVARLPHPLGHAMAATVGGRVLLMGGRVDPSTRSDRIWWFDPAGDRFSRAGRLPRPLTDAAVAVVGSDVWLLGGEDPGVTGRVVRVVVR